MKRVVKTRVIGLMSGTSADGIDVACCDFECKRGKWSYELIAAKTYYYAKAWKKRFIDAHFCASKAFQALDIDYTNFLAKTVNSFKAEFQIKPDYIASHGHTIFHQPTAGMTVQIGNGAILAALCGTPVICDFRSIDVALGGEGAPLVPIGDELLFSEYDYCLNLGGVANISYQKDGKRVGFDIVICNMVLNLLANLMSREFDADGKIAKSGQVLPNLLKNLDSIYYYSLKGHKSLGAEWFAEKFFPIVQRNKGAMRDKMATVTEHIVYQIRNAIPDASGKMLVTGGGAKNAFLMERLTSVCNPLEIVVPEKTIIDFKEAIIFAFLGCLRVYQIPNVLSSVTGASRDSVSGALYEP